MNEPTLDINYNNRLAVSRKMTTRLMPTIIRGQFLSFSLLFAVMTCALIVTQRHNFQQLATQTTEEQSLSSPAFTSPATRLKRHIVDQSDYDGLMRLVTAASTDNHEAHQRDSNRRRGGQKHRRRHRRRSRLLRSGAKRRKKLLKRQAAVELAINELHILESLDEQLQSFADSAELVTRRQESEYRSSLNKGRQQQQVQLNDNTASGEAAAAVAADDYDGENRGAASDRDGRGSLVRHHHQHDDGLQQVCSLNLMDGLKALQTNRRTAVNYKSGSGGHNETSTNPHGRTRDEASLDCLEERSLWRFIPPYVLNLYRQLIADLIGRVDVMRIVAKYHGAQEEAVGTSQSVRRQSTRGDNNRSAAATASQLNDFVDLAVQLMPYQAQVMRTFRQPPVRVSLREHSHEVFRRNNNNHAARREEKQADRRRAEQKLERRKSEIHRQDSDKKGPIMDDAGGGGSEALNKDGDDERLSTTIETKLAPGQPNERLVFELSTLPMIEHQHDQDHDERADEERDNRQFAENGNTMSWRRKKRRRSSTGDGMGAPNVWQPQTTSRMRHERVFGDKGDNYNNSFGNLKRGTRASEESIETGACDFGQRLLSARDRNELCFWFHIDEQLQRRINGSLEAENENNNSSYIEQLVEAELHLFKLPPQVMTNGGLDEERELMGQNESMISQSGQQTNESMTQSKWEKQATAASTTTNEINDMNRLRTTNLYHLKTNLLEVSLYQILPRKDSSADRNNNHNYTSDKTGNRLSHKRAVGGTRTWRVPNTKRNDEFPLRLLDIRRIDLDSNGWETFYVKRAVEDWLRDEKSNLGLVIKARSMFDEPIEIGLIRFVDVYDHSIELRNRWNNSKRRNQSPSRMNNETTNQANANFDLSHQPLLVIYTTTTNKK